MGLGILILGLVVFLATHVFVSFREARASVIARVGLPPIRGLFAIVSLVGLALIVWGYGQYRAHGSDSTLVAARLHAAHHRRVDAVRGDLCRRRFRPEPHQDPAQASDAGRREDLGAWRICFRMVISVRYCCSVRSWLGVFMPASPPNVAATLVPQRSRAGRLDQ